MRWPTLALVLTALLVTTSSATPAHADPKGRPHLVVVDACAPDHDPDDPVRAVPLPGDMDVCDVSLSRRRGTAHLAVSLVDPAAPERGRLYRLEWLADGCVRQVWWPVVAPQGTTARTYDTCDPAPPAAGVSAVGRTLTVSVPNRFAAGVRDLGVMTYVAGLVPDVEGPVSALHTFHLMLRPSDVAGHPPH